jgi:hypothetical protein
MICMLLLYMVCFIVTTQAYCDPNDTPPLPQGPNQSVSLPILGTSTNVYAEPTCVVLRSTAILATRHIALI